MSATETINVGAFDPAIPIHEITPSGTNPRKKFDETELVELAASIKEKGVIQPIVVRPNPFKGEKTARIKPIGILWEIVAGERRWRASKLAGITTIPAIVRELDDKAVLEIQVIENLQRADVHELDEANGYRQLISEHGYTAEVLAEKVGKSKAYVYGRLKLADLSEPIQARFYAGEITSGHAILLARLPESSQLDAAKNLFEQDRSGKRVVVGVRDLADWIQRNIQMDLAKAPFSPKDGELLPAAGACVDCPKRSGAQPDLFPELGKNDHCTDRSCYDRKVTAFIKAKTVSGDMIAITSEYVEKKRPKGALHAHSGTYRDIKHSGGRCEFTKFAIHVDGYNKGEILQICSNRECRKHFVANPKSSKSPKEAAADRTKKEKANQEREFRKAVHVKICGRLKDAGAEVLLNFGSSEILAVLAMRIFLEADSDVRKQICDDIGIKTIYQLSVADRKKFRDLGQFPLMRLILRMISADCLSVSEYSTSPTDGSEDLLAIAGALDIDHGKIRKETSAAAAAKTAKKQPAKKAAQKRKAA